MNKVVAIMEVNGPENALIAMQEIREKKKLETFYLYHSLLGEMHSRLGHSPEAKKHFDEATQLTQSGQERRILKEKKAGLFN